MKLKGAFSNKGPLRIFSEETSSQDGRVSKCCAHLLSKPHQNYNWNTEKLSLRTIWSLAGQKSYTEGYMKEATSWLVGGAKTQNVHPHVAGINWEGYLTWGVSGPNPASGFPTHSFRKRSLHNFELWKPAEIAAQWDGQLLEFQAFLLKGSSADLLTDRLFPNLCVLNVLFNI